MNYLKEELELLDIIESGNVKSVPFNNDKIKQMAKKTKQFNKKQQIKQASLKTKGTP